MEDGESGRNRIREFDLETETFCDPMDFGDYTLNEFTILITVPKLPSSSTR